MLSKTLSCKYCEGLSNRDCFVRLQIQFLYNIYNFSVPDIELFCLDILFDYVHENWNCKFYCLITIAIGLPIPNNA